MKRIDIPKGTLEQMYLEKRLTTIQIGEILGVSPIVVSRRLREYEIPRRNWADYYRVEIPIDQLRTLYWDENLAPDEIAEIYECAPETVLRRIHEAGIPLKPLGWRQFRSYIPANVLASWPSSELAYVVGLIASDGCLKSTGNSVHLASVDREVINNYLHLLQIKNVNVMVKHTLHKDQYIVEFADPNFRTFLDQRGLTPNKSTSLPSLDLPQSVFVDFVRGVLDGDGWWSIEKKKGCGGLEGGVSSASPVFLEWLQRTIYDLTGLLGRINEIRLRFRGDNALRFGRWLYYTPDLPCLSRKRVIWEGCYLTSLDS